MSKSILVIDTPEDFDFTKCKIGGDGNIYYGRQGERYSIIGNVQNLKPMPERKNETVAQVFSGGIQGIYRSRYYEGWNACIEEIEK